MRISGEEQEWGGPIGEHEKWKEREEKEEREKKIIRREKRLIRKERRRKAFVWKGVLCECVT